MSKTIARNKKAYFDYEIIDEFEAGIILTGGEVKSIKSGKVSLTESFVRNLEGELFLINMNVSKWPQDTQRDYDPTRRRKILLKKREREKLILKIAQGGYTIIPLSIYMKGALLKLKIGIARGKKKYEKKAKLIEKQREREMREDLKRTNV